MTTSPDEVFPSCHICAETYPTPATCSSCTQYTWCTRCGSHPNVSRHALECAPKKKAEDEIGPPSKRPRAGKPAVYTTKPTDESMFGGEEEGADNTSPDPDEDAARDAGRRIAPWPKDMPIIEYQDAVWSAGASARLVLNAANVINWEALNRRTALSPKGHGRYTRNTSVYLVWGDWVPWQGVSALRREDERTWRGARLADQAAYEAANIRACTINVYHNPTIAYELLGKMDLIQHYDEMEKHPATTLLFTWTVLVRPLEHSRAKAWCLYDVRVHTKKHVNEQVYVTAYMKALLMFASMAYTHSADIDVWLRNGVGSADPLTSITSVIDPRTSEFTSEYYLRLCAEYLRERFSAYTKHMTVHFPHPLIPGRVNSNVMMIDALLASSPGTGDIPPDAYASPQVFVWSVWRDKIPTVGPPQREYPFITVQAPGIRTRANTVYMKLVGERSTRLYYATMPMRTGKLATYLFDNSFGPHDSLSPAVASLFLKIKPGGDVSLDRQYADKMLVHISHTLNRPATDDDLGQTRNTVMYISEIDVLERMRGRGYGDALMVLAFREAIARNLVLFWQCSSYGFRLTARWRAMSQVHRDLQTLMNYVVHMRDESRTASHFSACLAETVGIRSELDRRSVERMDAVAGAVPNIEDSASDVSGGSWASVANIYRSVRRFFAGAASPTPPPAMHETTERKTTSTRPHRRAPPRGEAPTRPPLSDADLTVVRMIESIVNLAKEAYITRYYDDGVDKALAVITRQDAVHDSAAYDVICRFLRGLYQDANICTVPVFTRVDGKMGINKIWSSNVKAITSAAGGFELDEAFNTWVFYMLTLIKYDMADSIVNEFRTLEDFTADSSIYFYVSTAMLQRATTQAKIMAAHKTYFEWSVQ